MSKERELLNWALIFLHPNIPELLAQPEPFSPDWVSPPGETIVDLIEEKDWTQAELAQRLGYTTKHLNQLIKGKAALTEDAALRLERVLGSTANFWLNREVKYREHLARIEQIESKILELTSKHEYAINLIRAVEKAHGIGVDNE